VLFFLGIYLEIPVKVLVCLAIVPIVVIFLPRKVQSWVWVCLTGVILGVSIWVMLPEMNSQNWSAYQYDNELDEILVTHSVPDANNAALIYYEVLAEYDETIFYFNYPDKAIQRQTLELPWDPNEYPQLAMRISIFDSGLERLITATQMAECRFEVPATLAGMKPQLKRLNQLKGWTRLMIRTGNRDLFLGNETAAVEKYLACLSLSQHLYQQKTLFGQSAAFDIELLATRALEQYIVSHCAEEQTLKQIEDAMSGLNTHWARCWPEILKREKLITKNVAALLYEVNTNGKTRMSRNVINDLIVGLGYRPQRIFVEQEQMSKVGTVALWFILPFSPEKLAEVIDERYDHYSVQIQKGEKLLRIPLRKIWILGMNYKSAVDWAAMQQVGYFWALDGQYRRHRSLVSVIHIFGALKRYHLAHDRWPESLDELDIENSHYRFDYVNDKPFAYQRTEDSFKLYSLGPNGIDDGGVNDKDKNADDIVFWPRMNFTETLDLIDEPEAIIDPSEQAK
jgi:hypothetical protein